MIEFFKRLFGKSSKISLSKNDGAIVLRADGKMQVFLPDNKDSKNVSGVSLILSALYVNLGNAQFTDTMVANAFKKIDREVDRIV